LTGLPIPAILSWSTDLCANMTRTHIDKRSRLVSAAVSLAYQNGFGDTSLADIAREAEVPLGNVYYYFKTKDEIGEAIVEFRLAQLAAQRQRWSESGSPKDRLCACVQGVFENKDFLAQHGCAVGTFCSELHKAGGSVATRATEILAQHLAWIESQFRALGKGKESNGLALHLLSAMQGVSVLAHSFHDAGLVAMETKRLKSWIQSL
jgi:AcrR family transcriptional regulator